MYRSLGKPFLIPYLLSVKFALLLLTLQDTVRIHPPAFSGGLHKGLVARAAALHTPRQILLYTRAE